MFTYSPIGTCSRQILFDVDQDNKMHNVRFIGGCSGNLQGIAKLVEGKSKSEAAKIVGAEVAKKALAKGIETVVFDRGGYIYTGRVSSLADGAREAGLKF